MAAANFMICSMVIAAHGKQRHAFAIAVAGGVTALIWGVYASATYFVFDLVVVGGFFVILLLGAPHRARLLATVALIAAFFITTGLAGYIEALTSVSMRAQPQLADLVNGLRLLVSDEAVRASFVSTLLVCQGQMSQYVPCISTPSFLLFAFSLAAAVCESALQMRSSERSRSTSVLLQLGLRFAGAAEPIRLFGNFHEIAVLHIAFAASTFIVLPFMIAGDWLLRRARAFAWPMFLVPSVAAAAIILFVVVPDYVRKHFSVN